MGTITVPVLESFELDFRLLNIVKSFVLEEYLGTRDQEPGLSVNDRGTQAQVIHFPDGRQGRMFFPAGKEALRKRHRQQLPFVGFFANRRRQGDQILPKVFKLDDLLLKELSCPERNSGVLGYFSVHLDAEKWNWGNLVIFESMEAITGWRNSEVHCAAIRFVLYRTIRTENVETITHARMYTPKYPRTHISTYACMHVHT